ncbi:hypothetical protein H0H81_002534 [Sphagnurus paluster]|uniref:SH3 domain-containing protein n=1 Tax=Sphagnurus paluster TaxID=117069 RepID=A0A9P7FVC1_9AGAR|nr:hypothetical protein H0H81_002534 [Sphagnurus paluster]
MQRKAHGPRRLTFLEHRATGTEAGSTLAMEPTVTQTSSRQLPVTSSPSSTRALAISIAAMGGLALVGVLVWRFFILKRRNARPSTALAGRVTVEKEYNSERHVDLADISIYTEKQHSVVLSPRIDRENSWVPQIKGYQGEKVALPEPAASAKGKIKSLKLPLHPRPPSSPLNSARTPPPSYYFMANGGVQSPRFIPIPPSPITPAASPPPPTPPANRKKSNFASLMEQSPLTEAFPTPRSESFAYQELIYPKHGDSTNNESSQDRVPRLMLVTTTFTPTLDDELSIKVGEIVHMLSEYRDGWCFVQRLGRMNAPKGAVPRFCLQDRTAVLPSRKRSNGSLKSQTSSRSR